jgi:hypothetical protein
MKRTYMRSLNMEYVSEESEESEEVEGSEDEDAPPPPKPDAQVVKRWKMVIPEQKKLPKTEMVRLCETLLMKDL